MRLPGQHNERKHYKEKQKLRKSFKRPEELTHNKNVKRFKTYINIKNKEKL